MASVTPMMRQYLTIKEQHKDCILFFRLGDFYEMFYDDAHIASKELDLALTGKECGLAERAPMCGVPFHSADMYINKLVANGFKVAVCEQVSDPAESKGLVDREVIRIITSGTAISEASLDDRENSFLLSIYVTTSSIGFAYTDVSTGEFYVMQMPYDEKELSDVIMQVHPKEIIINDLSFFDKNLTLQAPVSEYTKNAFHTERAKDTLLKHFRVTVLDGFGLTNAFNHAISAAGALMQYLNETQKNALLHITQMRLVHPMRYMFLDTNTRKNLELTESIRSRQKTGSLLWLLDKTSTSMGGRLLRIWLEQPLIISHDIQERLDAIETLLQNHIHMMSLRDELGEIYDLERMLSRISYGTINARDCLQLMNSLDRVINVKKMIEDIHEPMISGIFKQLDPLPALTELIRNAIDPNMNHIAAEVGVIKEGYNKTLDEYRVTLNNSKQWIINLELQERSETGIKNLKIQYNKVFGYYIEVTKSYYNLVPLRYQRKQTLANCERFITPELFEMEQKIYKAQDQTQRLESLLFVSLKNEIASYIAHIQQTATGIKVLDVLLTLAVIAQENKYVKPIITEDHELIIKNGRHAVVEKTMSETGFIPNNTFMNADTERMLIITGPNMAGKSTYMRQIALIVLMAHIGSYVPADEAIIPITDRIFTRVGASDELSTGKSTFMVEMVETAHILNNLTKRSLVLLDEIGRGTSTFDGLSIAWAVVEYLCAIEHRGVKTLFATHYHELTELEGSVHGVANYCVSVKEQGEDVIFLRKIIRGGADKSFGIHVSQMAGIPKPVFIRAREIQARLDVSNINQRAIGKNILEDEQNRSGEQVGLFDFAQAELIEEIRGTDVMALTPMEAMNKIFLWREKARKLKIGRDVNR